GTDYVRSLIHCSLSLCLDRMEGLRCRSDRPIALADFQCPVIDTRQHFRWITGHDDIDDRRPRPLLHTAANGRSEFVGAFHTNTLAAVILGYLGIVHFAEIRGLVVAIHGM